MLLGKCKRQLVFAGPLAWVSSASFTMFSCIGPPPQLAAGDRCDNAFNVCGRKRRHASCCIPCLEKLKRDERVDPAAQQVTGQLRDRAIACAFHGTVRDKLAPGLWRQRRCDTCGR